MNDEIGGPTESEMVSHEGHRKNGWRAECLEHRLSKRKGMAPQRALPRSCYCLDLVSATQRELSYYNHSNCIGFAILFALNL